MRVKRGTLPSTREGGRLYVLLNIDPTAEPERPHDREYDRTNELVATLREQLEAERQAHAEARRIIAGMVERMPPQLGQAEAGGDRGSVPAEREGTESRGVVRTWATNVAGNVVANLVILVGGTAISVYLYATQRVQLSLVILGSTILAAVLHDFFLSQALARRGSGRGESSLLAVMLTVVFALIGFMLIFSALTFGTLGSGG